MHRLEGRIAVVTGGSSGIGLAAAQNFLREGAMRVYITGRRQAELDSAVAALGAAAIGVQGDVSRPEDVRQLYQRVKDDAGRLDVVFANAGYAEPSPLGQLSEAHVDGIIATNIKGVIWTVQEALPLMTSGGSIILSASVVASKGFNDWSLYSASKAAVRSLARTWASDLKGRNIRVNAVSPGVIETPAWDNTGVPSDQVHVFFDFAASVTPLGRTGRAEEIAKVVTFLASDDASFVNASEIFADGGLAQI